MSTPGAPSGPPPSYEETVGSGSGSADLYPRLPETKKEEKDPKKNGPINDDASGIELIVKATDFAARRHRMQRRKDPHQTPYINHPVGVAYILTNEAKITDPIILAAAILHDTVEDTKTTHEELLEVFGKEVATIVAECTDDKSQPTAVRKQAQIDNGASHSRHAKIVHLADKLYNLRDLERVAPIGWDRKRIREYANWSRKVLEQLTGAHPGLEQSVAEVIDRLLIKYA
uniref:Guanosine-3',5'-bis(diphosphate) 3'-pyrophosphohydrolase MESH1 n=1 Tax=Panagrellus redivivus TaxID=6233 RepID=A0A7E4VTP5_PANRE